MQQAVIFLFGTLPISIFSTLSFVFFEKEKSQTMADFMLHGESMYFTMGEFVLCLGISILIDILYTRFHKK